MDFTPVIKPVLDSLGWFIPLVPLINVLKSSWVKGQIGELLLRLLAHPEQYEQTHRPLHNGTLSYRLTSDWAELLTHQNALPKQGIATSGGG